MHIVNKKKEDVIKMDEKIRNRIFKVLMLLVAVTLVIMGVDIEIKLHRLSAAIPVVVYENADTTQVLSSSDYTEYTEGVSTASTTVTASVLAGHTTSQTTSVSAEDEQIRTSSVSETAEATAGVNNATEESLSSTDEKEEVTSNGTESRGLYTEQIYYVTKSGTKYHIGSCGYLSKSKVEITADEILSGGYQPCSRCIK